MEGGDLLGSDSGDVTWDDGGDVFDQAVSGLGVLDASGRYVRVNQALCRIVGRAPEDLLGRHPVDLTHPDDQAASIATVDDIVHGGGQPDRARKRYLRPDGTVVVVDRVASPLRDRSGRFRGILVQILDATEVSDAQDALRRTRARRSAEHDAITSLSRRALVGGHLDELLAAAVGGLVRVLGVEHCSVLHLDAGGDLAVAARSGPPLACRPYRAEVGGRPASLPARAILERRTTVWNGPSAEGPGVGPAVAAHGLHSGVAAVVMDANRPWGALVARSPDPDGFAPEDVAFVEAVANLLGAAVGRDRVERELRARALSDELTGLPNRAALLEQLTTALTRRRPGDPGVAVLFIDADDLKVVNDSIGHAAGDAVIAAVARRLGAHAGDGTVVARFSGDEFVVCREGCDLPGATALARTLRDALGEPIEVAGRVVTVTASVGIAVADAAATTAEELLSQADTAMYEAKRRGKDATVAFDGEMRRQVEQRLEVSSGLRRALEADELVLHYQPIVEVASGATTGCEALVRWERPGYGLVGPAGFVPPAEASGLILPLGRWVLDAACRQAAAWQAEGRPTSVSLNVSARQLASGDCTEAVAAALAASGVDPGRITLEVTESAVVDDVGHAARVIDELHGLGVLVALDDFGTGWSSLSQLADLPFDIVKIDRAFIARVDRDATAAALLAAIAELCSAIGVRAVAEGVETAEQLRVVRRLGIPRAQGFLLGRPAPASAWAAGAVPDRWVVDAAGGGCAVAAITAPSPAA